MGKKNSLVGDLLIAKPIRKAQWMHAASTPTLQLLVNAATVL